MNRKFALGYIAAVGGVLFAAAGMTIAEQQRKIMRLKQEKEALVKVLITPAGLDLIKSALKEHHINQIISKTDIPNDTRKLS